MKMTAEHFEKLKQIVSERDTPEARAFYISQGYSDKRYRWDLAYLAGSIKFICDELYKYLDDEHIDTALRQIVKPLIGAAK